MTIQPPHDLRSAFAFTASLPPASKSNHRHGAHPASSASWRRFKAFESALTLDARAALPSTWPDLAADAPLRSRPKVAVFILASTLVDAANLPKSVTDALEGVCYVNDASACYVSCLALRSSSPAASIAVAAFDPEVSPETILAALPYIHDLAHQEFVMRLGVNG